MKLKMRGIFVTGTDTGVGKTVVAAGIAAALKVRGINAGVMKPVHTGCGINKNGKVIPTDSHFLAKAASVDDPAGLVTPYQFIEPVAPYMAALENGVRIDIDRILECYKTLCARHDYMIVEGIGGVLVPVTHDYYVADLIQAFRLPALIVTRPSLGTINHTMLTINCLRRRKIPIKGLLINYSRKGGDTLAEKRCPEMIARLSGIPVLGIMFYIPHLKRQLLAGSAAGLQQFIKLSDSLLKDKPMSSI